MAGQAIALHFANEVGTFCPKPCLTLGFVKSFLAEKTQNVWRADVESANPTERRCSIKLPPRCFQSLLSGLE
eukprot:469112-Pelagomonas_calceolata.AAC.1